MATAPSFPQLLRSLVSAGRTIARWTPTAWREHWHDTLAGLGEDPGPQAAIAGGLAWLGTAQDHSASHDGGLARHYSLLSGWATSYPETTGYAIPTLLHHAHLGPDGALQARAVRALDWLLSIQFPSGAFQGSTIGVAPQPVTFDTGQILLGLAAGATRFGEPYRAAMVKAADWLVQMQREDGSWAVENPYLSTHQNTPRTFETHVAWGLLEAARVMPDTKWGEAGLKNIRWAVGKQLANGWFPDCCLTSAAKPYTHTLAYALRGVLEGYLYSHDPALLEAALRTARALAAALGDDGFLAGTFDQEWRPGCRWSCLTGTAQSAICWLLLYQETQDETLRDAALKANRYVRRTLNLQGPMEVRGAVKGSFPITGKYGRLEYLNWACKFMIDANTLELALPLPGR